MHVVGAALLTVAILLHFGAAPALAEQRVALVIGNDLYPNLEATDQLERARSDARSVGDQLAALGFTVIRAENAGRQQMVDAIFDLTEKIEPGDTALIYYAGHGVAIDGSNYLIPADIPAAGPGQESRIRNAAIAEASIISDVKAKGARVLVMVLDACRNNPFKTVAGRSIGGERGLTRVEAPGGVFGIYSAGYGESALDRLDGRDADPNSVFTRIFLGALSKPDLTLVQIAKETQAEVQALAASVRHEQTPGYYDQIIGDVVLNHTQPTPLAPASPSAAPTWIEQGVGDCGGQDVGSSSGKTPQSFRCGPNSVGQVAVCWDGVSYKNKYPGAHGEAVWCTYKDTSGAACSGGGNPGRMYVCGPLI